MDVSKSPAWFAPKRFGYGAGLPIAWQGWAVLGVYAVVMVASSATLSGSARIESIIAASIGLVAIAARTTKGGWRWRDGSDRDRDI